MKTNKVLREQIFEIIDNQLKANDPPETALTYKRLKDLGYSDSDTKKLISQCLSIEIFGALKYQRLFDEERYVTCYQNPIDLSSETIGIEINPSNVC